MLYSFQHCRPSPKARLVVSSLTAVIAAVTAMSVAAPLSGTAVETRPTSATAPSAGRPILEADRCTGFPTRFFAVEDTKGVLLDESGVVVARSGIAVIGPQSYYSVHFDYTCGMVPIRRHLQVGWLDSEARMAVPPRFERVGTPGDGLIPVLRFGRWGFFTPSGEPAVPGRYFEIGQPSEGLIPVRLPLNDARQAPAAETQSQIAALIRGLGSDAFATREAAREGLLEFGETAVDSLWLALDSGSTEVVASASEIFQTINESEKERPSAWGFIDHEGRVVIEPRFESAASFSEGLARVTLEGKQGFIRRDGTFAIEPRFRWAYDFSEGVAVAADEADRQAVFLIDPSGRKVAAAPEGYRLAGREVDNGLIAVRKDRLVGFMRKDGTIAIEPQWDEAGPFRDGLARVKHRERHGFINTSGEVVIPLDIPLAWDFNGPLAKVRPFSRGWGFINREGRLVFSWSEQVD